MHLTNNELLNTNSWNSLSMLPSCCEFSPLKQGIMQNFTCGLNGTSLCCLEASFTSVLLVCSRAQRFTSLSGNVYPFYCNYEMKVLIRHV